jgi:hypothetical protein
MSFLPRLLGIGLLSVLLTLLLMSCETSKPNAGEFGSPTKIKGEVAPAPETRVVAQITDSATVFKTSQAELAAAFIRYFNDGTVIDKILVRKAPDVEKAAANYFVVGMGLRNGMFRAIALPLKSSGDNTYYLSPTVESYVITGVGCPTCFFNFENGRIVGTTCGENSGGSRCNLKVTDGNNIFAAR